MTLISLLTETEYLESHMVLKIEQQTSEREEEKL